MKKKTYERPAIVHTEKLEARAATCTKSDSTCMDQMTGQTGPIQS